jgi:hypothetical protein
MDGVCADEKEKRDPGDESTTDGSRTFRCVTPTFSHDVIIICMSHMMMRVTVGDSWWLAVPAWSSVLWWCCRIIGWTTR